MGPWKTADSFYFDGKWPKISLWKTPDKSLIHRKTADNYDKTWKFADSIGFSPCKWLEVKVPL